MQPVRFSGYFGYVDSSQKTNPKLEEALKHPAINLALFPVTTPKEAFFKIAAVPTERDEWVSNALMENDDTRLIFAKRGNLPIKETELMHWAKQQLKNVETLLKTNTQITKSPEAVQQTLENLSLLPNVVKKPQNT